MLMAGSSCTGSTCPMLHTPIQILGFETDTKPLDHNPALTPDELYETERATLRPDGKTRCTCSCLPEEKAGASSSTGA